MAFAYTESPKGRGSKFVPEPTHPQAGRDPGPAEHPWVQEVLLGSGSSSATHEPAEGHQVPPELLRQQWGHPEPPQEQAVRAVPLSRGTARPRRAPWALAGLQLLFTDGVPGTAGLAVLEQRWKTTGRVGSVSIRPELGARQGAAGACPPEGLQAFLHHSLVSPGPANSSHHSLPRMIHDGHKQEEGDHSAVSLPPSQPEEQHRSWTGSWIIIAR